MFIPWSITKLCCLFKVAKGCLLNEWLDKQLAFSLSFLWKYPNSCMCIYLSRYANSKIWTLYSNLYWKQPSFLNNFGRKKRSNLETCPVLHQCQQWICSSCTRHCVISLCTDLFSLSSETKTRVRFNQRQYVYFFVELSQSFWSLRW